MLPLVELHAPLLCSGGSPSPDCRLFHLMEMAKKPRNFPAERTGHSVPLAASVIEFEKVSGGTRPNNPRRRQGGVAA